MSTRFSASMNTVRVRDKSPRQPRGRKFPSKATFTPCCRTISTSARKRPIPILE